MTHLADPTTMRAVTATKYGSAAVLQVAHVPRPRLRPGEVRVAVEAAAVTRGDIRLRAAAFGGLLALPGRLMFGVTAPRHAVQGTSFAGRIIEVGPPVHAQAPAPPVRAQAPAPPDDGWKVGDLVFGLALHGAHAEEIVVRADGALARRPVSVDATTAAGVAYGVATAWSFLADFAALQPAESVAVLGVGGVGRAAVQVAAALGANVTVVCRPDHAALAHGLGAARVVHRDDAPAALAPASLDVVFDTTGQARVRAWRSTLRPGARFVALDTTAARLLAWAAGRVGLGPRVVLGVAPDRRDVLEHAIALVARGDVRPRIAATFPLADAQAAHRLVETGRPAGDVVLRPDGGSQSRSPTAETR